MQIKDSDGMANSVVPDRIVLESNLARGYKKQLSLKFFLLIKVKMPITVGILTFMSKKNSILSLYEPENAEFLDMSI